VAATDSTVLIWRERSGKDLLAQEIHARSPRRRQGPMLRELRGAAGRRSSNPELFGFERGAFTRSAAEKRKFELASGGTIFLDEIGDMNPVTQPKSCAC